MRLRDDRRILETNCGCAPRNWGLPITEAHLPGLLASVCRRDFSIRPWFSGFRQISAGVHCIVSWLYSRGACVSFFPPPWARSILAWADCCDHYFDRQVWV